MTFIDAIYNPVIIYIAKLLFAMVAAFGVGRLIRLIWDHFTERG
jgi:hypothetical protein